MQLQLDTIVLPCCSYGGKTLVYNFWVGVDGTPLRLHMRGPDPMDRAHFDGGWAGIR